ncbi:MAG: hypothetical protein Kow0074_14230 [Candidatus Zixiibacteriota bacterium]
MTNRENRRVLVVDDEAFIRDLLVDFFDKLGFEVVTAADGNAGVEAFRQGHYSAVLVDLKMPGKSGIETLSDIRALDTKTPVIIMTGYPTIDTSIEALRLGAYDYIIKPFKLQDLRDIVDRAIREQELHAEIDTLRGRISDIEGQLREHRAATSGRSREPETY